MLATAMILEVVGHGMFESPNAHRSCVFEAEGAAVGHSNTDVMTPVTWP